MTRKTISILLAALFLLTAVTAAMAAFDGNARKGKYLYRKNCRTCHGASASDLSPISKTQAEWTKIYGNTGAIPCADEWKGSTSDEDLKDIFTYLHDYAKDSPSPAKCS